MRVENLAALETGGKSPVTVANPRFPDGPDRWTDPAAEVSRGEQKHRALRR
jgi:hypothetical protein